MSTNSYLFLGLLLLLPCGVVGQSTGPKLVSDSDAKAHVTSGVDPVYPPIAVMAHVSGDVIIQAVISETGHPIKLKVLSGPPMLILAAADAVRGWQFSPFEEQGVPVPVTADIKLEFPTVKPLPQTTLDRKTAEQFQAEWLKCSSDENRSSWTKAIASCEDAAKIAETFPSLSVRHEEFEEANEELARSFEISGQPAPALEKLDQALTVSAKYDYPTGMLRPTGMFLRGWARAQLGQKTAALSDYAAAEQMLAENAQKNSGLKLRSEQLLVQVYSYDAALAASMGDDHRSATLMDDAKKLNPKAKVLNLSDPPLKEKDVALWPHG